MSHRRHIPADDFDDAYGQSGDGLDPTMDPAVALASTRSRAVRSRVSEAMSAPVSVGPGAHLEEIASLLESRKLHGVAVARPDGMLLGVVTRNDILARLRRSLAEASAIENERPGSAHPPDFGAVAARDLLTPHPAVVNELASVAEAASMIAERNVHQLPVVSNSGRLVGLVTTHDLARWLAEARGA